eukprot:350713-Chlamydomonas_euryale.AAC.3
MASVEAGVPHNQQLQLQKSPGPWLQQRGTCLPDAAAAGDPGCSSGGSASLMPCMYSNDDRESHTQGGEPTGVRMLMVTLLTVHSSGLDERALRAGRRITCHVRQRDGA